MGKLKGSITGVVMGVILVAIMVGQRTYIRHRTEQNIQQAIDKYEKKQRDDAKPKPGPVGNLKDGIRWQD